MAAVCPKADWWMPLGGKTLWWDSNGDGVFTVSDAGWVFGWVYHAPGDSLIALLIGSFPGVATFFEMDCSYMGGWTTGIISAFIWLFFLLPIAAIPVVYIVVFILDATESYRK